MTRDEAKKMLPVIQAFADGKDIEVRCNSSDPWMIEKYPSWYPRNEYRIKPDPLECWMVRYGDGSFSSRKSKELAEQLVRGLNGTNTIHHMREVIE